MNIIGEYRNGNYSVTLLSDGTKIRHNDLDYFEPEYPESIDLKITNKCYGNGNGICSFCHECSSPDGKRGDILNLPFLDTMPPYTEISIGGGNPLLHPDLVKFLKELRKRKLIANITVNQWTFMQSVTYLKNLTDAELIRGLGVSLTKPSDDFIKQINKFPNGVIHVINGVVSQEHIQKLANKGLKILILGYKEFGRGNEFYEGSKAEIDVLKYEFYKALPEIVEENWFECVSFDNLAIKQLDPKRLMSEDEWSRMYMGDDGQFTMYIDAVNREYAASSTSTERFPITDNIKDMFAHVKEISLREE